MISPYGAMRTHGAGTLRVEHDGQDVAVAGWIDTRRDHGGVVFLDLRDRSGTVQVVVDPASGAEQPNDGSSDRGGTSLEQAHRLRSQYVVRVEGTVRRRPEGMDNPSLATGEVEVHAADLEVLSTADTPPFPVEDGIEVDETLRLRHRYLDLRRPEMQRILRLRAATTSVIRRVMERHGFVEVETPVLTRATPEGARDFLVPARLQPGSTYALPQSPQLFKQLLMVAGLERYYQIARCFRDEAHRADRQAEFTQLDVELSFGDEEDVYALVEELFAEIWREVLGVELDTPFPRMAYAEAMRRYGTDKPDLRFGMELADLSDVFSATEVGVFRGALDAGGAVVAVTVDGGGDLSRKDLDGWVEWAKRWGARGLAWGIVEGDGSLRSPLAKFMSDTEAKGLREITGAEPGDAVFVGAGARPDVRELMGALRLAVAKARH
ncbi:MAG TPA: aspartate--tRNA ligase, partial [Nitriliruptorales bacterium]|nr:aspartate--tRNA ligase [Nitriliruptorales bacterium]